MANMTFQKAERKKAKVKIAIGGPAGSGKSYSALRVASGIAKMAESRIAMIGTEKGRNEYYSDEFDYDVLNLDAPYSPERYIEAINLAEQAGYKVCIIDSATHEWHGQGGILNIKDNMSGTNEWVKWNKLTPRHNAFIEAITRCDMHIIMTARGKDQYVIEADEKGKQIPKKIGLGIDQRDGLEYEFTVAFMLDMDHKAQIQKDNTRIFDIDSQYCLLTEEHGIKLYEWAEQGKTFIKEPPSPTTTTDPEECDYMETLEAFFKSNNTNSEQKALILAAVEKRKKNPVACKAYVQSIVEKAETMQALDQSIMALNEDLREPWIVKKESCEKIEQYKTVLEELRDYLFNTPGARQSSELKAATKVEATTTPLEESPDSTATPTVEELLF